MKQDDILKNLPMHIGQAVAHYWRTRAGQKVKQKEAGQSDQGLRGAVTGGAQMDAFVELFCRKLVLERHYTASAFITSKADQGIRGVFSTPAADLSFERFAKILTAHLSAFV